MTLHRNGTAAVLYQALDDVQTHSRALDVGVQALKQANQLALL
jgi:hypothetical protein